MGRGVYARAQELGRFAFGLQGPLHTERPYRLALVAETKAPTCCRFADFGVFEDVGANRSQLPHGG